jgi:hypothetical protein
VSTNSWPRPLAAPALRGLAGDFVRTVEPHTEADPAALLLQFLVGFGSAVGRGPHVLVGADRHGANLFATLAGETSRGRKGTAEGWVRALVARVDQDWAFGRMQTGLSSGEGLLHAVRDVGTDGRNDPGEPDKRLLVIEPEFARVLQVIRREGSTLSTQLRQAWDAPRVARTMTRTNPMKATEAHISMVAHITEEELRAELTRTDAANGFGNRFLWVGVKRSKLLPDGGTLRPDDLGPLAEHLALAVDWSRQAAGQVQRDGGFKRLWRRVYGDLSADVPGLVGAVTSRAEAQVLRLSLVYALLDCSEVIQAKHLEAALAVWRYCRASAAHIFGKSLGDWMADEILRELRAADDGLTRTDIRNLLGRNQGAGRIGAALELLARQGLAACSWLPTAGRRAEVWKATTQEDGDRCLRCGAGREGDDVLCALCLAENEADLAYARETGA